MKIEILTNADKVYSIVVQSKNFEEVVDKILEKKYIKLSEETVILTSSITEIKKVK